MASKTLGRNAYERAILGNMGDYSPIPLMRKVMSRDPCVYCGVKLKRSGARHDEAKLPPNKPRKWTLDHIHPKTAGGQRDWYNCAPTCASCNNHKGNQTLLEWLLYKKNGGWEHIEPHAILDLKEIGDLPRGWYYPLQTLMSENG